ncbi:hypothetical protein JOD54_001108 [Actinokineospora baliensis]|uniref:hypothetical protein n=1 Tax=Actinokineospora baliensis TaxID=547056 RepID=UPI00195E08EC|nr:hypothetical protein [Actinokineospora baliensis]MBM7770904.1 hypothetical protein [Actinokineospora baliensis]
MSDTDKPTARHWLSIARATTADFVARNAPELVALAGAALVAHGVGAIYSPAGRIVAGLALIVLALCAAKTRMGGR